MERRFRHQDKRRRSPDGYFFSFPRQGKPKLLDRARDELRKRHYRPRTEEAYLSWITRYIRFHRMRHPAEMAKSEVEAFLSSLAVERNVAASTQNQALAALLFLYRDVLGTGLSWLDDVVRAMKPKRLPVVLTRKEIQSVLGNLYGQNWIAAMLMYGAGLRLLETLQLRVKDIDFGYRQITVRQGKGNKDRLTVLPGAVENRLKLHLEEVRIRHDKDLKEGGGCVTCSGNPQSSPKQMIPNINSHYSNEFPTRISMRISTFFPLYYADSQAA